VDAGQTREGKGDSGQGSSNPERAWPLRPLLTVMRGSLFCSTWALTRLYHVRSKSVFRLLPAPMGRHTLGVAPASTDMDYGVDSMQQHARQSTLTDGAGMGAPTPLGRDMLSSGFRGCMHRGGGGGGIGAAADAGGDLHSPVPGGSLTLP
jgi:hypothetical protein